MTYEELDKVSNEIKKILPEQIGTEELSFLLGMIVLEYSPDKDAAMFHLGKSAGHLIRYLENNPEHFARREAVH